MKPSHNLRLVSFATLFLGLVYSGPTLSKSFVAPDFDIQIELTERAQNHFKHHQESVHVQVTFANFYGVGMQVFGTFDYQLPGSASIPIRHLKFSPKRLRALKTADYEVHVDVKSGLRSSPSNLLACDFLQERISQLQNKTHTLRCDLTDQAAPAPKQQQKVRELPV